MAETSAAAPVAVPWPYTPCRCSKCAQRPLADGTACSCRECQPGPGLDMHRVRIEKSRRNAERTRKRVRISELLGKAVLTDDEDAELIVLLDEFSRPA